MESENRVLRLKAKVNKAEIDYSYAEMTPCLKEVDAIWEKWISASGKANQVNDRDILHAIYKGSVFI